MKKRVVIALGGNALGNTLLEKAKEGINGKTGTFIKK